MSFKSLTGNRQYNIKPPEWCSPSWEPEEVVESLEFLRSYTEQYIQATIDWYYGRKAWKAACSRALRASTIIATAAGGLMPVLASFGFFSKGPDSTTQSLHAHQFGYICFGFAALCIAMDKFFGISTGWMRYIGTAMSLQTALDQFRLDWAKITVPLAGEVPSGLSLECLIQKIAEFTITCRTFVERETQAWVTEFQTNLSQLEKETRAAVDAARAQVETMQKSKEATLPGAIDLTVENFLETDTGYSVAVDGKTATQNITNKTCGLMDITPGLHEVSVAATLSSIPAHASQVVEVKAASATKVVFSLARAKSAGLSD